MAAFEFALDITIDGDSFVAARGTLGERQVAVQYVPKVKQANLNAVGDPTLDPLEYATFHRGAGASRSVGIDGMVGYVENAWTCEAGLLMPGPEVTAFTLTGATAAPRPDGIAEADGNVYVAAGRYVFRIVAAAGNGVQDLDLTVGHVGKSIKRFGTGLFLSQTGGTGALYERPDGGVWTGALLGATAVAPTGALGTVFWTTGAAGSEVTLERLVAQFGARGLRYCASSPRLDTSWTPGLLTPAIDVGADITRFANTRDHVYIATTSGLRDLDVSGLSPNLMPEAEHAVLATGGLAALIRGGIGFSSTGYELRAVFIQGQSAGIGSTVTPMANLPNETPAGGYGTALVVDGKYLVYSMYDLASDTTWVCWGREAESGGLTQEQSAVVSGRELGPYVWNVAPIVLHGFKVTAMHVTGLATDGPRLLMFGQTLDGTVSGKWAPLAFTTPYADLKAGRSRHFAQSCFVIMPSEDGGNDALQTDVEEVLHEGENMTAGNTVRVSAAKEGESTFTPLVAFTSGPRVIQQVKSAFVTQRPTFKIEMQGTSALSPPITRRISVRRLPNPDLREVRRYILSLGRATGYGSGNRNPRDPEEQLEHLIRLATAAARATMTDERNTALVVRVLKVDGPSEVEAVGGDGPLLAVGVTVSLFGRAAGAPFGYDATIGWDSGHSWS